MRVLAAAFFVTVGLWAQAPPEPGSVKGKVLSSAGEPIGRATVTLTPIASGAASAAILQSANQDVQAAAQSMLAAGQAAAAAAVSATTDANGAFVFEKLAAGRYRIAAQKTGYMSSGVDPLGLAIALPGQPNTLEVLAGKTTESIEVKLTKQAAIYGRITDEFGDPVPQIQVRIFRRIYSKGGWQLQIYRPGGFNTATLNGVTTGADGAYSIGELEAGRYFVVADKSRTATASAQGQAVAESYLATYYPNATSMDLASGVQVTAGTEVRGIDIRMQKAKAYSVQGKVVGPGRIPKGYVTLSRSMGTTTRDTYGLATLRDDGSFLFTGVPSGSYLLELQDYGTSGRAVPRQLQSAEDGPVFMARVPVNIVDKNIENMVVQAAVGATVEVTIQREAPQGANGSAVNLPALPMGLQPLDGSAVLRPDRGNGKAVIKDVAPGPYALDWSLGGEYVKRVRYDNQDVTDKPIVVGTTGGKLEIELGTDAGSAAGTVRDEKGTAVGGLSVTVWSASAAREGALLFSRTANALPTGMARVAGLRPGEYFIVAWEKIDTQSGINSAPEFLKQFESKATRVKIEPKAQLQNLDFKIIPVKDIEAAIARLP